VAPREARKFHLDWAVRAAERGAVVRGQLWNPYGVPVRDIHLLVQGLDASGTAVTTTTTVMRGIVRSRERATFDVPVASGADRYQVTVVAWDLVLPRGGR
jgi:hypothetical protein